MQAGDKIEEVISQHQSEIDKLMLHLLDRRIQTAKDLENEQPQIVQGLTLLYKRYVFIKPIVYIIEQTILVLSMYIIAKQVES